MYTQIYTSIQWLRMVTPLMKPHYQKQVTFGQCSNQLATFDACFTTKHGDARTGVVLNVIFPTSYLSLISTHAHNS